MPLHARVRRSRLEGGFRLVAVFNVPHVRVLRHAERLLLEPQLGVRASDSVVRPINLPGNFGNGTFDHVRVFEDHKSLGEKVIGHGFSGLSREIFFEEINFVVLLNASLRSFGEILGSLFVARVLGEFFQVSYYLDIIGGVILTRPASNIMGHSLVFGLNTFSVDSVDLHQRDVVTIVPVGVLQKILSFSIIVGQLFADSLGL